MHCHQDRLADPPTESFVCRNALVEQPYRWKNPLTVAMHRRFKKPSPRVLALRKIRPAIGFSPFNSRIKHNANVWFKPNVRMKRFPYLNMYTQRWPRTFSIAHFARYVRKNPSRMTLFQLAHCLPYRGVGCVFSRYDARDARINQHGNRQSHMKPKDCFNTAFRLEKAQFTIRPFFGRFTGSLMQNNHVIRSGVIHHAREKTQWSVKLPDNASPLHYRPPFPRLPILQTGYKPPFYQTMVPNWPSEAICLQSDTACWDSLCNK